MKDLFTVEFIDLSNIANIKEIWLDLEKGKDMTYFQTYDWNEMLINLTPKNKSIECGYFLVKRNNTIKLIAPLWIIKKWNPYLGKTCFLIGRKGFSDYLNFIYKQFDPEAITYLINYIKRKYGISKWLFENIKEDTEIYNYLHDHISHKEYKLTNERHISCGKLHLPSTKEEYINSLSKNTRQNLRTAQNRANKDYISFQITIDDTSIDKKECERIRGIRSLKKNGPTSTNNTSTLKKRIKFIIKHILFSKFNIYFPSYLPFYEDKNSKILSIKDIETGEIAAFFNYGLDNDHKEVVVMAAGVNEKYSKYSPGMLSMKYFIDYQIEKGDIQYIDFTRGDEAYKFHLGSKLNTIHHLEIKIK